MTKRDLEGMMMWGVIEDDATGLVHVGPVDEQGDLLSTHKPLTDCQCCPRQDDDYPELWIHNDPAEVAH